MEDKPFTQFEPAPCDIEADEIIKYLLKKTEQESASYLDIAKVLNCLRLKCVEIDFAKEFGDIISPENMPRALISFPDKIIAIQNDLYDRRKRFSILHEIAHYVLPHHRHDLFLCVNEDFSPDADKKWEVEANTFASDLLFLGGKIEREAHENKKLSARLVKELADKYLASYEATARRLASKSLTPYMLLVFKEVSGQDNWPLKYTIPSKSFKMDYFSDIFVELSNEMASEIKELGDVSKSIEKKCFTDSDEGKIEFNIELFSNTWHIFAFLSPSKLN